MKKKIEKLIIEFIEKENETYRIFREPLVGFAKADSEYMNSLGKIASKGHAKPACFMEGAKVVIAYFIPFTKEYNDANRIEGLASESWAKGYEDTNAVIRRLNDYLITEIEKMGYRAMTPPYEYATFDRENITSKWSQRHMGYAAGLGTFGLNNMLITEKGCSGRLGSVVSDFEVEYDEPMKEEQCLYFKDGICKICMKNCMSGAITEEGFDRKACFEICTENAKVHNSYGSSYGSDCGSEVCGKCISFSPCAYRK